MEQHGTPLAIALEHEAGGMLGEPGVGTRRIREKHRDGEPGGLERGDLAVAGAAGDRLHPDRCGTGGARADLPRHELCARRRARTALPGREQDHDEGPRPPQHTEEDPAQALVPVVRGDEGGNHAAEPPDKDHSHAPRAPLPCSQGLPSLDALLPG